MIYLSAHPDELYFRWQSTVQLENFKSLDIDMGTVFILVGIKPGTVIHEEWTSIAKSYGCNVIPLTDTRISTTYLSSIRPHLIAKFLRAYPDFQTGYIFYHDNDIIFREVPPFYGMMDGRWHVSKADYISYDYIAEKQSPSLIQDMLNAVGIDEEIPKKVGKDCGGVQYLIYNTTAEFWDTVERSCEVMFSTHHKNLDQYKFEYFNNIVIPHAKAIGDQPDFDKWREGAYENYPKWDFQIWCTDMWCVYWTALKLGISVVIDPILDFCWPGDSLDRWEKTYIFHNSGVGDKNKDKFLLKQAYKTTTPFKDPTIKEKGYSKVGDNLVEVCQRKYLEIIEDISGGQSILTKLNRANTFITKLSEPEPEVTSPTVSCIMTTYGRFQCVERSIGFWLNQTYPFKELIIYNTADVPLELSSTLYNKGVRVINNHYDMVLNKPYDNVGAVRRDAASYATGDFYICWDDDDMFLPWHIEQGISYIVKYGKEAYMPERSMFTQDGGLSVEYARNSMEASCIIKLDYIRELGFLDSNGGEHLSWRRTLVDRGILNENYSVTPWESYMYIWGESIAPYKQSGNINDPNNFNLYKEYNQDFGNRPLEAAPKHILSKWYRRIAEFSISQEVKNYLSIYSR